MCIIVRKASSKPVELYTGCKVFSTFDVSTDFVVLGVHRFPPALAVCNSIVSKNYFWHYNEIDSRRDGNSLALQCECDN